MACHGQLQAAGAPQDGISERGSIRDFRPRAARGSGAESSAAANFIFTSESAGEGLQQAWPADSDVKMKFSGPLLLHAGPRAARGWKSLIDPSSKMPS